MRSRARARGPRRAATAALLVAIATLAAHAIADWRSVSRGEGPDSAPVRRIDGEPYIAVNDLARLLDATKFWRADARKLVLRSGRHSITLTVDNPFVVVNERTLWMPMPVRSSRGGSRSCLRARSSPRSRKTTAAGSNSRSGSPTRYTRSRLA